MLSAHNKTAHNLTCTLYISLDRTRESTAYPTVPVTPVHNIHVDRELVYMYMYMYIHVQLSCDPGKVWGCYIVVLIFSVGGHNHCLNNMLI